MPRKSINKKNCVAAAITGTQVVPSISEESCPHEWDKVFKITAARKKLRKLKDRKINCETCERTKTNCDNSELFLCVTCGVIVCAIEHIKYHLTRVNPPHPIYISLSKQIFRCLVCQIDLNPVGGNNNSLIQYYNSFVLLMQSKRVKSSLSEHSSLPADLKLLSNPEKDDKEKKKTVLESKSDLDLTSMSKLTIQNCIGINSNSLPPAKGLQNNGNTCFFNSVLQCILHTYPLMFYIEERKRVLNLQLHEEEDPLNNMIFDPYEDPLHKTLANAMDDFRGNGKMEPSKLLYQIALKSVRFFGGSQQDAHELLRYFIDGLRTEELNRLSRMINEFNEEREEDAKLKFIAGNNIFEKEKQEKQFEIRGRPLLDAVFGGTLLQTILCSNCGHLSKTFEQFFDLSLPLPRTSKERKSLNVNNTAPGKKAIYIDKRRKVKSKARRLLMEKKLERKKLINNDDQNGQSSLSENDNGDETMIDKLSNEENLDPLLIDGISREFDCLSITEDEKLCLNPLSTSSEFHSSQSLSNCLSAFTVKEFLSGSEAFECDNCCVPYNKKICNGMVKRFAEAQKGYLIYEPPTVLILHIKRFEQINTTNKCASLRKSDDHISFPLLLDLAPYCTSIAKRIGKRSKVMYALYGVVSHLGDMSNGHYVAYVRNRSPPVLSREFYNLASPILFQNNNCNGYNQALDDIIDIKSLQEETAKGTWYFTSDSKVSSVPLSRVLNSQAYILFYERIA